MNRKYRHRGKKRKILFITVFVTGIAAMLAVIFGMKFLHKEIFSKENKRKTPEEILESYMAHIPKEEYKEMYEMLDIQASGDITEEDFIKRNTAIYEGIEVQNMTVEVLEYEEENNSVKYQTSFDTIAGNISFENEAVFKKDEEGYKLVWQDSVIFPGLNASDKVRVSTTQAERGKILDRNERVLAGKGVCVHVTNNTNL